MASGYDARLASTRTTTSLRLSSMREAAPRQTPKDAGFIAGRPRLSRLGAAALQMRSAQE